MALAIQEARRGNYSESTRLFKQGPARPTRTTSRPWSAWPTTPTTAATWTSAAKAYYEDRRRPIPDRGETPYNLAQVYFKKLFVPEATEAMDKARALGFIPPSCRPRATTARKGYAPVVYPPLTDQAMKEACRFEAANYPPLVILSAWRHLLGAPPLPLYVLVGGPLLLALFMIMWWNRQNDPTRMRELRHAPVPRLLQGA